MWYIILSGLVLIICVAGYLAGKTMEKTGDTGGKPIKWASVVIGVLFIGIFSAVNSFQQVDAGHVGVVYRFGNIVGQTGSGFKQIAPWENLRIANVQVQRFSFEALDSFSKETQDVFIKATLNYEISPVDVQTLYRTVGPDYFNKLVPNRVNQFFKDETVKYRAVDIAPNRDEIRADVLTRLKSELKPYSIQVDDLLIDNISFSKEFTKSIEDKQIATQEAQAAENRVAQAEFQAQQVAARAQGDADAVLIKAKAQAKANNLLNASLSPQLINYTAIKTLAPTVQTILLPSNSNFILPDTILKGK